MSDEAPEATPAPSTDEFVEANWDVAVIPGENISIHYRVLPLSEVNCITSVSASVVEKADGVVMHSFFGCTVSDSLAPKAGQGMVGDTGADISVFHNHHFKDSGLEAILAGTVRTEHGPANFFFSRPVDISEVEQAAEEHADDDADHRDEEE